LPQDLPEVGGLVGALQTALDQDRAGREPRDQALVEALERAQVFARAVTRLVPPERAQATQLIAQAVVQTFVQARAREEQEARAREDLIHVRRVVNEYRDDQWDQLVRARNRLMATVILTGLFTFGLLAFVVLDGVDDSALFAATVLYFVGALIGLVNRTRIDSESEEAIEDYGLSCARLINTPQFSGLAALGGVLLISALPTLINVESLTGSPAQPAIATASPTATATPGVQSGANASPANPGAAVGSPAPTSTPTPLPTSTPTPPSAPGGAPQNQNTETGQDTTTPRVRSLSEIYRLTPGSVILAGLFGLTPGLLLDRLRQSNRFMGNLISTEASNRADRAERR